MRTMGTFFAPNLVFNSSLIELRLFRSAHVQPSNELMFKSLKSGRCSSTEKLPIMKFHHFQVLKNIEKIRTSSKNIEAYLFNPIPNVDFIFELFFYQSFKNFGPLLSPNQIEKDQPISFNLYQA